MIPVERHNRDEITRVVHEVMFSMIPTLQGQTIAGDKSLAEHGADSVDRVEIILAILKRLGARKPLSEFSSLADINEMVDFLCEMNQV
jgi:polyketide biosynthesis acyl carrier protein